MLDRVLTPQSQALQVLFEVDSFTDQPRYLQTRPERHKNIKGFTIIDKENRIQRKGFLPKLNNSKDQLKLQLKKLQTYEEPKPIIQSKTMEISSKPNLPGWILQSSRPKNNKKSEQSIRKQNYTPQGLNRDDNIHSLIRKNNYSTNTLNLKTLNILHQLNSQTPRHCTVRNADKKTKKMVAFLRRVA